MFGDKKANQSQDQQIKQLQKQLGDCWAWIQSLNKNQEILIQNNKYFIERDKVYSGAVGQLQAKDKLHDQKDAEHDQLINSIKSMAKAVEQAEATT